MSNFPPGWMAHYAGSRFNLSYLDPNAENGSKDVTTRSYPVVGYSPIPSETGVYEALVMLPRDGLVIPVEHPYARHGYNIFIGVFREDAPPDRKTIVLAVERHREMEDRNAAIERMSVDA